MLATPALRPRPMLLTVGELAALLQNIEPRSAVLAERIRGWTKQKLIEPTPGPRGTGKHHRYDASSVVFEVLLLNALANAGLHIASLPYVQSALAQVRKELPKWREAQERSKTIPPLFLVIQHRQMHAAAWTTTEIKIDRASNSTIIINLARLFGQVVSSHTSAQSKPRG